MNNALFMGLVYNAALLLALALLFDLVVARQRMGVISAKQIPVGILVGGIGIAVMLTRWELLPGAVFDTRSILLGISGLFFGTLPTLIAMAMTAAFRIYDGGVGALTGCLVILATGGIGILTRRFWRSAIVDAKWWHLYLFGVVIHLVMIALMFTFPWEIALHVVSTITFPVLVIYPLGTMLLGMLMVNRMKREFIQGKLTERESELERTNRALRLVSDCNEQLVRATNESDLLHAICRVIVESGGYKMAWVGFPQRDEARSVLPVASAGEDNGYLKKVHFHWGEDSTERGLTGEAMCTRAVQVAEDTLTDPRLAHIWTEARKRQFGSLIAIPLLYEDDLLGALTIHAGKQQAFSHVEVALLSELAEDMAFGIHTLRQRDAHTAAQAEALSQARFPEENPNPVLRLNAEGDILYANPAAHLLLISQSTQEEQEIQRTWKGLFRKAMRAKKPIQQEWEDRGIRWIITVKPFPEDEYANFYFLDVTELTRTHAELAALSSRQEALLSSVPVIIMEVDTHKRYTWANDAGFQFFGDDVLGREAAAYFDGEQDTYRVVEPLFNGHQDLIYVESWQRRVDGQKRLLAWWCRTLRDEKGNVTGVLSSAQDITEQFLFDAKIRESEERWRGVFEKSTVGKSLTGVDGKLLQVNPAFASMLGYSMEAIHGVDFAKLTYPEDVPASWELVRHLVAGEKETDRLEKRYIHRDGHFVWADISATLLRDADNNPLYFITDVVDITEKKKAEEALRQSQELYHTIIDGLPDGLIHIFDRDFKYVFNAGEGLAKVGLTHEMLVGKTIFEVLGRELGEFVAGYYRKVLKGETVRFEGDYGGKSYLLHAAPLYDQKGKVTQILVLSIDITLRKAAEKAMKLSEARYRNLVETQADIIARSDLQGNLTFVNDAYCKVFGITREELLGKPFYPTVLPEDLPIALDALNLIKRPPYRAQTETRHKTTAGIRWYIWENSAVVDEAGNIIELQGVGRDITERKAAEDAIRQINKELEQRVAERTAELATINKQLETFAYTVSHDLKAPLRGIDGYSKLILEEYFDKLDEKGRQFLGNIRSATETMSMLIDDLLAYSRMDRRTLLSSAINPNQILAGILREYGEEIQSRGVVIEQHIAFETLQADPEGMSLVLRNLIDNALKFTAKSAHPKIEIGGEQSEGETRMWVCDNGIGFDMKYAEQIFEIFQRLQRAEDYPGTGVGLAIVRKAMQQMGGRVWAESTPGEGATFHLAFRSQENEKG